MKFCRVNSIGEDFKFRWAEGESARMEDAGTESSPALEKFFHPWAEGLVHPITRGTFDSAFELGVADGKGFADEGIEVDALGQDVAA